MYYIISLLKLIIYIDQGFYALDYRSIFNENQTMLLVLEGINEHLVHIKACCLATRFHDNSSE